MSARAPVASGAKRPRASPLPAASAAAIPEKRGKKKRKKRRKSNKPPPSLAPPVLTSRRQARKITSQFHNVTHEIDRVRSDQSLSGATRAARIAELERELEAFGGRKVYQDASIISTELFRTSRHVCKVLTKMGARPRSGERLPKVLEVGAINMQLSNTPWLDVDALDLNSRHPTIQQIDFFDYPCEPGKYDVVVCSMVINCIPTPQQRGQLLVDCGRHLRNGGYFFLMLPLLCLNGTPYVAGPPQFKRGVEAVGFRCVDEKLTKKVALFTFEKTSSSSSSSSSSAIAGSAVKTLAQVFPDPPRVVVRRSKKKRFASSFAISCVQIA